MSLNLKRKFQDDVVPVFLKVFELFTGGFAFHADAVTALEGVTLPPGTFLDVDEEARTCKVVKRAVATDRIPTAATQIPVEAGHLFSTGDIVGLIGATASMKIAEVRATDDGSILVAKSGHKLTNNDTLTTGRAVFQVATSGATGPGGMDYAANAMLRYSATVDNAAGATALRRGTVYERRVPPVIDGYDKFDTVLFSKSK